MPMITMDISRVKIQNTFMGGSSCVNIIIINSLQVKLGLRGMDPSPFSSRWLISDVHNP
jgi:hypothetical protein